MSDFDERYVSRREFNDFQRETEASLAELAKAQAVGAAELKHLPGDVRTLTAAVRSLETAVSTKAAPAQPTASPDSLYLGIRELISEVRGSGKTPPSRANWFGIGIASAASGYVILGKLFGWG